MKKHYIVVIDSGIGGLSTLANSINHFKSNYYYFADSKNIPYGTHNSQEIQLFLAEIITNLKKICDFKIVVLACNTATATSIEFLRKKFKNIVFIGTEPAVKLAYNRGYKKILVLTTPTTAKQQKFKDLKSSIPCNINVLSIPNLAKDIENFVTCKSYFSYAKLLENIIKITTKAKGCDCIVLGCTHYVFLKQYLRKFTDIKLVDSNDGVQKQLSKIANNLGVCSCDNFRVKFGNSLMCKASNQIYKKILSQILANAEDL